jgi:hypothetical protein
MPDRRKVYIADFRQLDNSEVHATLYDAVTSEVIVSGRLSYIESSIFLRRLILMESRSTILVTE